jgi:predicted O-linked N-acetylglucosamine transferase (SPINDLY family)
VRGEHEAVGLQSRFRQGLALHRQGELTAAERIYREVLEQQPRHFDSLHMLGVIALQTRRAERGIELIRKAIGLNEKVAAAHDNLGKALLDLGRPGEALAGFDRATALDPGFAEAHVNRGNALVKLRRLEEALVSYQKAVALRPDHAEAHRNCGNIFSKLRRHDEAFAAYDKVLTLKPNLPGAEGHRLYARMHLCDWSRWEAECAHLISSVRNGHANTQPFIFLAIPSSSEDHLQCAKLWAASNYRASEKPVWQGERYDHERIRVAYLSADFRQHALSFLMAGMFECHDKSRFEVTAISFGVDDNSEIGQRVKASFERFVDARSYSDEQIADLIKALEIDIVVDLMGFTTDSRTGIFARRPAPVQAHYLGYPGTMGARYIDYLIADRVVVPDNQREFYSEKLVLLPDSYLVNDRKRAIADRTFTRTELGLPLDGFVFCCFNNNHKITPRVFDCWMRILGQVEGSVLWLFQDNAKAADNLKRQALARGVNAERLIFAGRMPPSDHLARHRVADLFLDTLPYNAHTTAADALWAGLPVLTCLGETFVGRVAASLLNAIGVPELITTTPEDYEALAVRLSTRPDELAAIRTRLEAHRLTTPLFDTQRFTAYIEAAYTAMHARHRAGLAPDHIAISNADEANSQVLVMTGLVPAVHGIVCEVENRLAEPGGLQGST